jgi:hypothetical protein
MPGGGTETPAGGREGGIRNQIEEVEVYIWLYSRFCCNAVTEFLWNFAI